MRGTAYAGAAYMQLFKGREIREGGDRREGMKLKI